jgi:divinyl protochlorophyllide a 8-vinyl-reductase
MTETVPSNAIAAAPGCWVAGSSIAGVAEVLPMRVGSRASLALFEAAGLLHAWHRPPQDKVGDDELRRLHQVLRDALGLPTARAVARDAGRRAADHLLAHHLPRLRQRLMRRLPAAWAAVLLRADLRRLAWTFAGDGQLTVHAGQPAVITIRGNPLCKGVQAAEPGCDFVCALLERLFAVLVHPDCQVVEVACESCGAPECRFDVRWQRRPRL